MEINKYDDSAKGGYSYAEKLALVAQEAMAPEEIGLVSAEQAKDIIEPPKRKLGDFLTFEVSEVPKDLQALWAYQESKIVLDNEAKQAYMDNWKKEHEGEIRLQGRVRSGTALAQLDLKVTDKIEGFCLLMEQAAEIVREEYANEKKILEGSDVLPAEQSGGG